MKAVVNDHYTPRIPKTKRRQLFFYTVILVVVTLFWVIAYQLFMKAAVLPKDQSAITVDVLTQTPASLFDSFFATRTRVYDEIRIGESLSTTLKRLQFPHSDAEKLIKALSTRVNMRSIRPGNVLMVEFSGKYIQLGSLTKKGEEALLAPSAVELFSKDEHGVAFSVRVSFEDQEPDIKLTVNRAHVSKEHQLINGRVQNSVYSAIVASGGDAQLVNSFSDIFGWQFDFFRDTREGDTYQMVVEKNVADGRFVGYSRVLAAEYTSNNKTLRGYYFKSTDGQILGYFDEEGRSLQNAFLKAPLKLAYISSPFNKRRFHPIQKIIKPHNGIDYGANLGTPFMAVAKGIVVNAGYSPFNGNWVRLKHMNGYETEYLHANRLAKGIHVGARVEQGQVIGYVGKTGLASGYHLHFGMKKGGNYVDPITQRFARNAGIPPRYIKEYNNNIQAMIIALNSQSPNKNNTLAQR